MKAAYINPFLSATINVLKTMASVDPIPGKPYMKSNSTSTGDISGVIGLTGSTQGSVVVSFTTACALKVISSMMMQEYTEINDEIKDAVGEITNMISGDARKHLAELGLKFEAGIPTVITGKGHEITSLCSGPRLVIPFKCDGLDFFVEASFED